MSSLISVSIDLTKIDKSKINNHQNGSKYYNLTLSVNDETNQYGQNVGVYDSQSKEERDANHQKNYLGNGKVVWTGDGKISVAQRQENGTANEAANVPAEDDGDLPF